MQTIYRGNKTFQEFDFQEISLNSPIRVGNGNYFMKYKAKDQSLYVQPPQCLTKQGIISVSKKHYIDLLFTNEDADFIQWMEKLEETSVNYIYNNRVKWFDGDMEKDDIENYFSSPFRIFRSGKYYILRVGIATTLGLPAIKVYDSDENEVSVDDINDTTQLMCILEIKGVKCGTRNFQIELETKQLMIVKPSNPFDKCLFKVDNNTNSDVIDKPNLSVEPFTEEKVESIEQQVTVSHNKEELPGDLQTDNEEVIVETVDEPLTVDTENISSEDIDTLQEDIPEVPLDISYNLGITSEPEPTETPELDDASNISQNDTSDVENTESPQSLGEQLEIMEEPFETMSNEMEEVTFPLESLEKAEPIQLKERNDIYYEMYYEARRKAKMAKEIALNCYLEARNIKNAHMLNDLPESDSDENISEV
jgi:hypothetical protein